MTISLIVANVIVFIYELMLGPHLNQFIAAYGAIPYELSHDIDLVGRYSGVPILHYQGPPFIYLTVFSSMFMHGSVLHIFGNMLYLWIFGNNIEDILGPWRFLFFYLACGVLAAAFHTLIQPNSAIPTIGASGAIAGVLGAYAIAFPRARVLTLVFLFIFIRLMLLPAYFLLVFWFVIQAFSGFTAITSRASQGGVAWFAHVGGFLAGIMLIKLMAGQKIRWLRAADM
jgi:membrane associated rhomboid family serine protease